MTYVNTVKMLRDTMGKNYVVGAFNIVDINTMDAVMVDGSSKPFDENITVTKEIVDIAHKYNVNVEGYHGDCFE